MGRSKGKKKNKKKYWVSNYTPKYGLLEPGMKGFLITGDCHKEQACIEESLNLFNEFADELYGPELGNGEDAISDEVDIEEQLAKEIETVQSNQRFLKVRTMLKGVLFISTTLLDPAHLVTAMFESVLKTQRRKTRFIQKVKPISLTCKAYPTDIAKALDAVLYEYSQKEGNRCITYKIECNIRHNTLMTSSHIRWYVRESMKKFPQWSQTVFGPEIILDIEVLRHMCCIGFLKKYEDYKRYNLSKAIAGNSENSQDCKDQVDNSEQPSGSNEEQIPNSD
ncbi:THUMP domain-containing protein 1-like [Uloborus diversus]|uniref:THUMP domain-containing protein 1-like n=1 Tax=Uloborus diversus TaxID=327109 RepID=UPI002409A193|nr:THUMP domain-containing protein 1-like [Uloborus diversus]